MSFDSIIDDTKVKLFLSSFFQSQVHVRTDGLEREKRTLSIMMLTVESVKKLKDWCDFALSGIKSLDYRSTADF